MRLHPISQRDATSVARYETVDKQHSGVWQRRSRASIAPRRCALRLKPKSQSGTPDRLHAELSRPVRPIVMKLRQPVSDNEHRRVIAGLAYLHVLKG